MEVVIDIKMCDSSQILTIFTKANNKLQIQMPFLNQENMRTPYFLVLL